MLGWEIFIMANVGRSEITPQLEFYRHLLLWHALSGSLHAVHFSFPWRQVPLVVLFPIILPFYPGHHNRPKLCFQFCRDCLSSQLEALQRSRSALSHLKPCRSPRGAGGGAAPNARTYRRPVASKLSRTRRLPTPLLLSPACWWKI